MRPTDILVQEHRVIEQVLRSLERILESAREDGKLDAHSARQAIDFFKTFADRCHHGKEETHLFPAMEGKGFPREGGPVGVMLFEHVQGRSHVRGMDAALEGASRGDSKALEDFTTHALSYIELLTAHIAKEDHCLFPMANQAFTTDDQKALSAAFDRVESEEMGQGTHEKYLRIADDLAKKYHVPTSAECSSAQHAGCGCKH